MNNIQETIEDNLFSFGFLPLLLVMKIYQDKEKYELCSIILKVLNEHSQKYKFKIPARYNADAIEEMKYNFMKHHNLSGNITEYNHAWYAAKIITEIERAIRIQLRSSDSYEREIARLIIRNSNDLSDFNKALKKCLEVSKNVEKQAI